MTTDNLREMSESDLEALIDGDDLAETPPEPEQADQTVQGEVSKPVQETPPAEPAAPEPKTEPRQVPLPELQKERQRRQQYEALLSDPQALAQRLQELGYQVAPAQEQPKPEFLDEDLAQWAQQQIQGTQQQIQTVEVRVRNQVSQSLAMATMPDYKDVVEGLVALQEQDPTLAPIIASAVQSYLSSPDPNFNPALATYQLGKRLLSGTQPALSEADINRRIEEGVAAALAKMQPGVQGPKGVARAGSVTPGAEKPKPFRKMTDEELDEQLYSED